MGLTFRYGDPAIPNVMTAKAGWGAVAPAVSAAVSGAHEDRLMSCDPQRRDKILISCVKLQPNVIAGDSTSLKCRYLNVTDRLAGANVSIATVSKSHFLCIHQSVHDDFPNSRYLMTKYLLIVCRMIV